MRRFLTLLETLGSAGARNNARAELELSHTRGVQAALLARRVDTIDAVASRQRAAVVAVAAAA